MARNPKRDGADPDQKLTLPDEEQSEASSHPPKTILGWSDRVNPTGSSQPAHPETQSQPQKALPPIAHTEGPSQPQKTLMGWPDKPHVQPNTARTSVPSQSRTTVSGSSDKTQTFGVQDRHQHERPPEHEGPQAEPQATLLGYTDKTKQAIHTNPVMPRTGELEQRIASLIDSEMPRLGDVLAERYRTTRLLGEGGFATVYEATDLKAGGRVAVKVLNSDKSHDPKFVARFDQEVQIVRELTHPNTIKVWDVGIEKSGLLFMVMEFVEGPPLSKLLEHNKSLDAPRAVNIIEQLLKALIEAHQRGIVHRDLKPDNILLIDMQSEADFVKILDFGIAKAIGEDLSLVKTQTGTVMGTPGYAAPEILLGEPVTPAADTYAVGLILTEMLSGEPLIPRGSIAGMVASQLSLDPEAALASIALGPFRPMLIRSLEPEPFRRYQDAAEMYAALRRALLGEPEPAYDELQTLIETLPRGLTQPSPTRTESTEQQFGALLETPTSLTQERPSQSRRKKRALISLGATTLVALLALLLVLRPLFAPDEDPQPTDVQSDFALQSPERRLAGLSGDGRLPALPGANLESMNWDWLSEVDGRGLEAASLLGRQSFLEPEQPSATQINIERAQLTNEAIALLHDAMESGLIPLDERAPSANELLNLYRNLIEQLLELDRCSAAESRLQQALDNATALPQGAVRTLERYRPRIEQCRTRRLMAEHTIESERYLQIIHRGTELYEQARALPAWAGGERAYLLERAAADHQEAHDTIVSLLLPGREIHPDHRREMEQQLRWLSSRIVLINCALGRCRGAEIALDESSALLSDETATLALREELSAYQNMIRPIDDQDLAADRLHIEELLERIPPRSSESLEARLEASPLDEPDVASDASPQPAQVDLFGRVAALSEGFLDETRESLSAALYLSNETQASPEEITSLDAPMDETQTQLIFDPNASVGFAEPDREALVETISLGVFTQAEPHHSSLTSEALQMSGDEEGINLTREQIEELLSLQSETRDGQRLHRALAYISTEPAGASLMLDNQQLGVTPFVGIIESPQNRITISVRRRGYHRSRVRVDMTSREVRERIVLEAVNPFGRIRRMGDTQ